MEGSMLFWSLVIVLGFVGIYIAARLISHAYFKSRQTFEESE